MVYQHQYSSGGDFNSNESVTLRHSKICDTTAQLLFEFRKNSEIEPSFLKQTLLLNGHKTQKILETHIQAVIQSRIKNTSI